MCVGDTLGLSVGRLDGGTVPTSCVVETEGLAAMERETLRLAAREGVASALTLREGLTLGDSDALALRLPLVLGEGLDVGEADRLAVRVGDVVGLAERLAERERLRVVLEVTVALRVVLVLKLAEAVTETGTHTVSLVTLQGVPTVKPAAQLAVQGLQAAAFVVTLKVDPETHDMQPVFDKGAQTALR